MAMTSRQRVMAVLNLEEPDKVPFADWIDPGIRKKLTERLGYETLPDDEFHIKMGMDAICYAGEEYIAPQFCKKIIDENGVAHLQSEGFIKTDTDLDKFILPDVDAPGYFDKAKAYMDKYGNSDLAVFASLRTGMMNTIFSMGLADFSYALYDNRQLIEHMLDRYIEWNIKVAEGLTKAGFDFLVCYDDIAFNSGPIVSPSIFREVFLPRMKKFASTMTIPWVYHSDGKLDKIFDDLMSMGMNAFNPFQPDVMDSFEYRDKTRGRLCFWGNIDLQYTLTRGTVEDTIKETKEKLARLAPGGGYLMATSNSITDYCKVDNIMAMLETKEKYGTYPIHIND